MSFFVRHKYCLILFAVIAVLNNSLSSQNETNMKAAFSFAIRLGDWDYVDAMRILIRCPQIVHMRRNSQDETFLHYASRMGNSDMVAQLLKHGAQVNALNERHGTALHCASDLDSVQCLVERGADIEALDDAHRTALHYAAIRGDVASFRYLVKAGAEIDAKSDSDSSPLSYAINFDANHTLDRAERVPRRDLMVIYLLNAYCAVGPRELRTLLQHYERDSVFTCLHKRRCTLYEAFESFFPRKVCEVLADLLTTERIVS